MALRRYSFLIYIKLQNSVRVLEVFFFSVIPNTILSSCNLYFEKKNSRWAFTLSLGNEKKTRRIIFNAFYVKFCIILLKKKREKTSIGYFTYDLCLFNSCRIWVERNVGVLRSVQNLAKKYKQTLLVRLKLNKWVASMRFEFRFEQKVLSR